MSFARGVLESCGWQEGQGLGRTQSGIKEALKVKLKFDTKGIGANGSEQFTYEWWHDAFNNAADNIVIDDSDEEIRVESQKELGPVSATESTAHLKKRFYGSFVKGGTLKRQVIERGSDCDSDSEEETFVAPKGRRLTDEELLRACGGLTGHKAARHGHKLGGKLARLQAVESTLPQMPSEAAVVDLSVEQTTEKKNKKAKKAKKEKRVNVGAEVAQANGNESPRESVAVDCASKKKIKRKKKAKASKQIERVDSPSDRTDVSQAKKEKKAKKAKRKHSLAETDQVAQLHSPEATSSSTKKEKKGKKSKKKSKSCKE
eukprot:m.90746 g.90746  ORF g.90746 m.90746 type:complete len:317 (-) comp12925_c1_seq1:125-1075(-)